MSVTRSIRHQQLKCYWLGRGLCALLIIFIGLTAGGAQLAR
jgi:hypothetical protein